MKKVVASLLLACFLIFTGQAMTAPVYAASTNMSMQEIQLAAEPSATVVPKGTDKKLDKLKEDSSFTEGVFVDFCRWLLDISGISSLYNLVFGNPIKVWLGTDKKVEYGLFLQDELDKIVKPLIGLMGSIYVGLITLAIMWSTLKMSLRAHNPQARSDFWTDVYMWVLSAFFMGTFGYILDILFGLNTAFVEGVKATFKTLGAEPNNLSIMSSMKDDLGIGDIFIMLAEWGLGLYLNFIYIARKVIIMLLLVMAPVAAMSLLYARSRYFFGTWMKELLGNIFLQSIHALLLFGFAGMISFAGKGSVGSYIFQLGMIIMFIPVSSMITSWLQLGDSSTNMGRMAGMMGFSSVAGAARLAGSAGQVMRGARQGGMPGQGGNLLSQNGQADDSTATRLSKAVTGQGSKVWDTAKQVGAATGGLVGATAGLAFGPVGSMAGAAIGSKLGKAGVGAARQVPLGLGMAAGNAVQAWKNRKDPAALRDRMGNVGEALGSMVGKSEAGRSIGQALSGVSRQRALQQSPYKSLTEAMQANPGASLQWRQTNTGSGFFLNGKQIGLTGAADSTLAAGETRAMDYKFANGQLFQQGANGGWFAAGDGGAGALQGMGGAASPASGLTAPVSAGMQGSTEAVGRVSGAYIQGANGARYQDSRFDATSVNPDSYFSSIIPGANTRSGSDYVANMIHGTGASIGKGARAVGQSLSGWTGSATRNRGAGQAQQMTRSRRSS